MLKCPSCGSPIKEPFFKKNCEYCGIEMTVQCHPRGGRTRKKFCSRSCRELMSKLEKAERELMSA